MAVHHFDIKLGVNSDTLKGTEHNHLKEIGIDVSCNGSKLFTTIPGAVRVILSSTHPGRYGVLDFLVESDN